MDALDVRPCRHVRRRCSSEVVLEAELHVARADLRPIDYAEVARAVAGRRIAEHRVVAGVRSFEAKLNPLVLLCAPALQQRGIQRIYPWAANTERARRRPERVRIRAGERALVEVAAQTVID